MKAYNTRQRQALLAYLMERADEPFSAKELCERLGSAEGISASALYRNLARLAGEGAVSRLMGEDGKTALYRYAGDAACAAHLHMKCTRCGRLLHMNETLSDAVLRAVVADESFRIDAGSTVLYGACAACRRNAP